MGNDKIFEKRYSVEIPKLILGFQKEEFHVDNDFFGHFEHSPVQEGDLVVEAGITKTNTHIDVVFDIKGNIVLECDRCTEPYPQAIEAQYRVIYAYDERLEVDTDEVVLIDPNEPFLSLVQEIYDFIILEIPIRKVPPESVHKCPPEVLRLLAQGEEETEKEADEEVDPRWEALRKLKDN